MRKMILTVLLFTVPAAVDAADETPAPTPAPQFSNTYTITKGDTLWGLAGRFYQDPHTWPKLWNANRSSVKDPNRIYPSQVIAVPDAGEKAPVAAATPVAPSAPAVSAEATPPPAKEEETSETAENAPEEENIVPAVPQEEAPAPVTAPAEEQAPASVAVSKPAAADKKYFSADGFIAPPDWQTDGVIVGDKDKKMMLSEGDTVYVNLGARKVQPGVQCNIYRKLGKVKDPDSGDVLGYEVRLVGRLTITEGVSDEAATARVTNSREPIDVGDMVEIVK